MKIKMFENFEESKMKKELEDFFKKEGEYITSKKNIDTKVFEILKFLIYNDVDADEEFDETIENIKSYADDIEGYFTGRNYSRITGLRYALKENYFIIEFSLSHDFDGMYIPLEFFYNFDMYKEKERFKL